MRRLNGVWLLLLLAVPVSAAAQERTTAHERTTQFVFGRLIDDATHGPIAGGVVRLLAGNGTRLATAITDSLGRFRLVVNSPGEYRLKGERIGYKTAHSPNFQIHASDVMQLDFWLSTTAVLLAPIEVKATARQWIDRNQPAGIAPFFERMAWYGKLGGIFLTREKVREWDGSSIGMMLMVTVPGARSDGSGNIQLRLGCAPAYYVNGVPFRLVAGETIEQLFSVSDLEAVEVYRGAGSLPGEFGGTQGTCAIVLWTRRS